MNKIKYICGTCGAERWLKFRAGRIDLSKDCHSCAAKKISARDGWGIRHGGVGTRLYAVWCGMKQRCSDAKSRSYYLYGGRGITVCFEWQKDFSVFRSWAMSNGYRSGLVLDRRDNDGNYHPDNCRWITKAQSTANRRNVKLRDSDAAVIKELAGIGVHRTVIAALYNTTADYVSSIKCGFAWASVTATSEFLI